MFDASKTILVWRFGDAPKEYQELSPHGGDEDWIAFIPAVYANDYGDWITWADTGCPFGCCNVSVHDVPGGTIRIGSHA